MRAVIRTPPPDFVLLAIIINVLLINVLLATDYICCSVNFINSTWKVLLRQSSTERQLDTLGRYSFINLALSWIEMQAFPFWR